jgi:hypothetical protein
MSRAAEMALVKVGAGLSMRADEYIGALFLCFALAG